jgi:CHAD domain-containing protein
MKEREVKLAAPERFELPGLGGLREGVVVPHKQQRLSTVYFDTDDFRLARWSLSFRYRAGQGWTVKLPGEGSGALLIRDEVVFEGSPATPPRGAVDLVKGYVRRAELVPKVRLRTVRRGVLLNDAQGRLIADVVDDRVSVLDGQRVIGGFRELEVETTDDTPPGLLKALLLPLRDAGAGAPDPTPKYVRAIGGADVISPEVVLVAPAKSASLGEVVTHAIASSVIRLLRHDPVVRLDTDPEGVHQARVATRRLRSDLRTFGIVLDPEWTAVLRLELGWLGGELGGARDADVLLKRLTAHVRAVPDASGDGARRVIGALAQRRAQTHAGLLEALRSDRYLELIDQLIEAAQTPALIEPKAGRGATKALPPLVRSTWRALDKSVKALPDQPADEQLHRVRILAKRCRYAAEASAPSLGERTHNLASAASQLQDVLGELNDAVVAERWLRDWATHARSGASGSSPASSPPWNAPPHSKHAHSGSNPGSA